MCLNPCWEAAPTGRCILSTHACGCPCVSVYKHRRSAYSLWELVAVDISWMVLHYALSSSWAPAWGFFFLPEFGLLGAQFAKCVDTGGGITPEETDVEFRVLSVDIFGPKDGILGWFRSQVTHTVLIFTPSYVNNIVRHQDKELISRTIGFCLSFWKVSWTEWSILMGAHWSDYRHISLENIGSGF